MASQLIEEMRPRQIQRIVRGSGIVFIPVSPRHEWHSYHLPLGTDGIIAEEAARLLAQTFDGAYFRALPLGLDAWRTAEENRQWGLAPDAKVFGMNFPGLPVASEYCTLEAFVALVSGRLRVVRQTGFRHAFLVNHHGGRGQVSTLEQLAKESCCDGFHCQCLIPARYNRFEPADAALREHLRQGGHAGMLETLQLLAFRPDLVDLGELPEGTLKVSEMGILHGRPDIPAELNPRGAMLLLAQEWRKSVLAQMEEEVRSVVGKR